MSINKIDNDRDHLFPEFRRKLEVVLREVADHTGEPWVIVEGYRSQARQDWLYAQGRSRPGPVVTWMRLTRWHGTGLAADLKPSKKGYQAARGWWELLKHIGEAHGLSNPAWAKGDLGHLQLTDEALRNEALLWVKRGFQD